MNRVILSPIFFLITFLGMSFVNAEDQPNVQNNLWGNSQQGISLAFVLKNSQINGQLQKSIEVYIRNDSHESKYYSDYGVQHECPIEYLDQGKFHGLYEEETSGGPTIDPTEIKPGTIHTVHVILEPTKLAIVRTHPVKCCVGLWDPISKTKIWIISSPKTL